MQKDKEQALWNNFRESRSIENRNALIEYYLPAVRKEAVNKSRTCYFSAIETQEFISAGVVAISESIEKFDSSQGCSFWTYARLRLRGAMTDLQRNQSWYGDRAIGLINEVDRVCNSIYVKTGTPASAEDISAELDITVNRAERFSSYKMRGEMRRSTTNDCENVVGDTTVDYVTESQSVMPTLIKAVTSRLTAPERKIFNLRYIHGMSINRLTKRLRFTESRVYRAIKKIERLAKRYS